MKTPELTKMSSLHRLPVTQTGKAALHSHTACTDVLLHVHTNFFTQLADRCALPKTAGLRRAHTGSHAQMASYSLFCYVSGFVSALF